MNRTSFLATSAFCLAVIILCAGCGADQKGRALVQVNATAGKMDESIKGTDDQLLKAGRIDATRRIKGADGVEIDVWVLKGKPAAGLEVPGTIVMLHGLGESKGSFPYLGAGAVLARKGYDVVLPDLRAHGRSGGKYVTYGAKEKLDVKAVMDELIADRTVHAPVYAFGTTLGGSTAIQYAAIDDRCQAVFAVTPYKDFDSVTERQLFGLPLTPDEVAAAEAAAEKLADFNAADASTIDAAAKLTIPLLLVHGMLDLRVPAEDSKAILAAARGPKKLELVTPGPEQVGLFTVMEDWVADKMDGLIRNGLPSMPGQSPAAEPPTSQPTSQPTTGQPAPKTAMQP